MTTVLVCGGRDYGEVPRGCPSDPHHEARLKAERERRQFQVAMDAIYLDRKFRMVVMGDARGADSLAYHWACRLLLPVCRCRADWKTHGRAAGPIRNQQMLDEYKPTLVVAFPGGSGTADMVRRAKAAGVEVLEPVDLSPQNGGPDGSP